MRAWIDLNPLPKPFGEPGFILGGAAKFTTFRTRPRKIDSAIAVAGIVAEHLYANPDADVYTIMMDWDLGELTPSDTDLAMCSKRRSHRVRAVQKALDVLRQHKTLFDQTVRLLLEFGEVPLCVIPTR